MEKKSFNRKLKLEDKIVAKLNKKNMNQIHGGEVWTDTNCDRTACDDRGDTSGFCEGQTDVAYACTTGAT